MTRLFPALAAPGLVISIFAIMAGLYTADQFLARLEQRELAAEARDLYESGLQSMRAAKYNSAVDLFRQARAIQRTVPRYQLGLAAAMIAAGKPDQAIDVLRGGVLVENSNHGEANLLMARARLAQNRFQDADAFYHRAIYGNWPENATEHRLQARLELVEMLARQGRQTELFAELLPLEEEARTNLEIARRIPAWYLQAGSLTRAEAAYRDLIGRDPDEAGALDGLGRVALQRGDYRAAASAFFDAQRARPNDAALEAQEQLARRALALDPTPRYLSTREKLARSNEILALTREAVLHCIGEPNASETTAPLLDSAELQLNQTVKPPTNEAAEARLEMASALWNSRPKTCASAPQNADLLDLLDRKMSK